MTQPSSPPWSGRDAALAPLLVSVNVGRPRPLGLHGGALVMSAIRKQPVLGRDTLHLGVLNLDGDGQADLGAHGGPDKAVYAYCAEHIARWSEELGEPLGPNAFGENLTLAGVGEDEVCIGDVWRWGRALLQVAQPRWPCYKLAMHRGREDMAERFIASGRSGWYLRVLQPGDVPVGGPFQVVERGDAEVSVARAFAAAVPGAASGEEIGAVTAAPALAGGWRRMLQRRLRLNDNRRT